MLFDSAVCLVLVINRLDDLWTIDLIWNRREGFSLKILSRYPFLIGPQTLTRNFEIIMAQSPALLERLSSMSTLF